MKNEEEAASVPDDEQDTPKSWPTSDAGTLRRSPWRSAETTDDPVQWPLELM
jgi:hypothetical protein